LWLVRRAVEMAVSMVSRKDEKTVEQLADRLDVWRVARSVV
jgi:hypothetical protein